MKNKQDYYISNGAYYCTKHDVKNCVVCFEQGEEDGVEEDMQFIAHCRTCTCKI